MSNAELLFEAQRLRMMPLCYNYRRNKVSAGLKVVLFLAFNSQVKKQEVAHNRKLDAQATQRRIFAEDKSQKLPA
jgi:hypothetical protein